MITYIYTIQSMYSSPHFHVSPNLQAWHQATKAGGRDQQRRPIGTGVDHRHCGIPKKEGSFLAIHLGVSNNRGTPKWMVKIMENPIKMDDLGGKPTIFGNTHF